MLFFALIIHTLYLKFEQFILALSKEISVFNFSWNPFVKFLLFILFNINLYNSISSFKEKSFLLSKSKVEFFLIVKFLLFDIVEDSFVFCPFKIIKLGKLDNIAIAFSWFDILILLLF